MTDDQPRTPMGAASTPTEAARQGRTFGTVRYVLGISLVLVILALAAVAIIMGG